ncbi:Hsp20/alpha crystallin family protein [Pontiella sp.]|uniref:Hsp20/alpha crystallin family protein n=1 Tax=Pontiella sp. TaxID=2837462 RepID=UPI003564EECC
MKSEMMPFSKTPMRGKQEWRLDSFEKLSREINDLLHTYHGKMPGPANGITDEFGVELSETDEDIHIRADLPGIKKKNIHIALDEEVLTIRAIRKEKKEARERNYHISEMSYGGVSRTIGLPARIDAERATAELKHGVLTLRLPKSDRPKRQWKQISLSTEQET